ncbi:MAG: hypothetical protein R3B96_24950 [Pirellulaceae bacterium]
MKQEYRPPRRRTALASLFRRWPRHEVTRNWVLTTRPHRLDFAAVPKGWIRPMAWRWDASQESPEARLVETPAGIE